jgi:hypothetical protein
MHNDFLQSLEIEFEQTLLSTSGLEARTLRQQVMVFDMLHRLDNASKIYNKFFKIDLEANKLLGETIPLKYEVYLDNVHTEILNRLSIEFDLKRGRLQAGFPHRIRFASSLLTNFFSEDYKMFLLGWLDTEEKSKEIFLMVLNLTVKQFEKFKQELTTLISDFKIGNETSIENILNEIMLSFRKMYLQKEQSLLKLKIGTEFEDKSRQLQKIKMEDVYFEFEKNFFDKINLISKNSQETTDKDNFFKLTMLLQESLYEKVTNYAEGMFERSLSIPLEQDVTQVAKVLSLEYIDQLNSFFTEVCTKITDYIEAIDHEQIIQTQENTEEEKKAKKYKIKNVESGEAIEHIKVSYKPPVEYFKFIFALEDLVKVLVGQLSKVLTKLKSHKDVTSAIEVNREGILSNMAAMIKVANQEILTKINTHCHYILLKHFKKSDYGLKKGSDAHSIGNIGAREELSGFLIPFFQFLEENLDPLNNAGRLIQTLSANTIETMIAHYGKLKNNKRPEISLADDIIVYNELFEDAKSDQIKVMYEKLKLIITSGL